MADQKILVFLELLELLEEQEQEQILIQLQVNLDQVHQDIIQVVEQVVLTLMQIQPQVQSHKV